MSSWWNAIHGHPLPQSRDDENTDEMTCGRRKEVSKLLYERDIFCLLLEWEKCGPNMPAGPHWAHTGTNK